MSLRARWILIAVTTALMAWFALPSFFPTQAREGRWWLHPLNPRYPDAELAGLDAVRGVVIQKSRPGSRRSRKTYVD